MRAFALSILLIAVAEPTVGAERCRVHEPAGKPVTVRPDVKGSPLVLLQPGRPVDVTERANDRGGVPWVKLADRESGEALGWVAKEAVSCF